MAIGVSVGDVYVSAHLNSSAIQNELKQAFSGSSIGNIGKDLGKTIGSDLSKSLNLSPNSLTALKTLSQGLEAIAPGAEAARSNFYALTQSGYVLQSAFGGIAGGVSSLIGGIGSLAGAAAGAVPSIAAMGNIIATFAIGAKVAAFGLSGVSQAVSKLSNVSVSTQRAQAQAIQQAKISLAKTIQSTSETVVDANKRVTRAQYDMNLAIVQGQQQIQQLGYDAEGAALSEQRAALNLRKARNELVLAQALPPNSIARQEALLSYKESDLAMRKAITNTANIATEQNRVAQEGVMGNATIRSATQSLSDAQIAASRAVRNGLQQEAQAQRELAKARAASGLNAANAMQNLTASQKDFVKYLMTLKPQFMQLKEAAASGFLPVLQDQMNRMLKGGLFDRLVTGFHSVSVGLGAAAKSFTDSVMSTGTLNNFSSLLTFSSKLLPTFGSTLGDAFSTVLTVLKATQPLTETFVNFVSSKAQVFKDFINTKAATGELTAFFNRAGQIAAQWGTIFGNVFGTVKNLVMANFGPTGGGQYMLNWLKSVTKGWKDLGSSVTGQKTLQDFFLNSAVNMRSMFSAIGSIIAAFATLGSMPEVKQFWDTLKGGTPFIKQIMQASVEAGPSLAKLLVSLTKIVAIFADSGGPKIFFDALNNIVSVIAAVLSKINGFLNIAGRFHAFFVAVAVITAGASFAFKVLVGNIQKLIKIFTEGNAAAKWFNTEQEKLAAIAGAVDKAIQAEGIAMDRTEIALARLTEAQKVYSSGSSKVLAASAEYNLALRDQEAATLAVTAAEEKLALSQGKLNLTSKIAGGLSALAKFGGYVGMAAMVVDGIVTANNAFNDMRQSAMASSATLTNLLTAGTKGFNTLRTAVQSVDFTSLTSSASDAWGVKFGASGDKTITTLNDMSKAYKNLTAYQDSNWFSQAAGYLGTRQQVGNFDDMAAQIKKTGTALGNLAQTNLPAAQTAFFDMTKMTDGSKDAIMGLIGRMPDYQAQLTQIATDMGISADKTNLVSLATGQFNTAAINAAVSAHSMATGVGDASSKIIDFQGALDSSFSNGQISVAKFMKTMEKQVTDAQALSKNLLILEAKGASDAMIQTFEKGGPAGAAAAAKFATQTKAQIAAENKKFGSAAQIGTDAYKKTMSDNFEVIQKLAGKGLGTDVMSRVIKDLSTGAVTAQDVVTKFGLKIAGISPKVQVQVGVDGTDKALKFLNDLKTFGGVNLDIKAGPVQRKANGGLITKFASGGKVRGPGGPREDLVPAMLSAGEYVVNAASTSKYLPLLHALNSGGSGLTGWANQGRLASAQRTGSNSTGAGQAQSSTSITMNVYPSAGMDETALADKVSRSIALQLRKGGI